MTGEHNANADTRCTHALVSRWPDLPSVPAAWRDRLRCAFCGALDVAARS